MLSFRKGTPVAVVCTGSEEGRRIFIAPDDGAPEQSRDPEEVLDIAPSKTRKEKDMGAAVVVPEDQSPAGGGSNAASTSSSLAFVDGTTCGDHSSPGVRSNRSSCAHAELDAVFTIGGI
jgi:hypothetical protein